MNTKKRWIITVIAALALAAIVVIGVILNHSADRVLKATDGSVETSSSSEEIEEQVPEEQPAEETIDLSLSAPEEEVLETTSEELSGQEEAAPETAAESEAPEVITEAAAESEEPQLITEMTEETEAAAEAGEEEHVFVTTLDNETAEEPEETGEEERVFVTTKDNEPSEEPEEETSESETEEEEESGETELRADAGNGTQVIVRKLHGSFPAGAYVKVFIVPNDSAQSAVEKVLDEHTELVDLIAYDITIYDKDGNEIIPDDDVEVMILGAFLEGGQDVSVYHIEDNGNAEKVTDVQDPTQISFGAQAN